MTKLCPRGKAAAKRKFKVYPSAYANAYASKICAGKIKDPSGVKRKDFRGPKPMAQGDMVKVKKYNSGAITQSSPEQLGPKLPEKKDRFLRGVSPYIEKSGSAVAGTQAGEEKLRGGVGFDTKIGNIGLGVGKTTRNQPGYPDFQEKNIDLNYTKNIPIGERTNFNISGGVGRSKSEYKGYDESKREQDTYQIGARIDYRFGQGKKSGDMIKVKENIQHVKGGNSFANYQQYVEELIK